MSQKLMNTKEVAQYLGVTKKRIYALARSRRIPATKVTGKWLFPKHLIDEWLESSARSNLVPMVKERTVGEKVSLYG